MMIKPLPDNVVIKAYINGEEKNSLTIDEKTEYNLDLVASKGDNIKVVVSGTQNLEKGVYFYAPEGDRKVSQSLVGISEGMTAVKADKKVLFLWPIQI